MGDLSRILGLLEEAIRIEKKIEETIASEKDKGRREKIEKAFKSKNLTDGERRALIASILLDN